jgi:glycosyltransferase involved in cell wall biosynthesis
MIIKQSENDTFISVVIAAFNEEKDLPKCLESLGKQKYPKDRFEVIVVDNNSTDKTAQIAREFGARVILEKKQGNTYAIKKGMDEAKGDIIAATDADSQVAHDWLWSINKAFLDQNTVAVTGMAHMNAKSKIAGRLMDIVYMILLKISAFIGKPNLTGFNLAFRKDAYLKVGGINPLFTMSSDVDLGIRLAKLGKIKVVKDMLVHTSARRWEQGFFSTLWDYAKGNIYAAWLRKPPPVKQTVIR